MHKFGYRFTKIDKSHEKDVLRSLRKKLERERSLRNSISREVSDLKMTLTSLKPAIAASATLLPPTHPNKSRQL